MLASKRRTEAVQRAQCSSQKRICFVNCENWLQGLLQASFNAVGLTGTSSAKKTAGPSPHDERQTLKTVFMGAKLCNYIVT